jgi:hypothetical protein
MIRVAVDPFFDGSEQEISSSQEYPISEIKMEMIVCKNLKLSLPEQHDEPDPLHESYLL